MSKRLFTDVQELEIIRLYETGISSDKLGPMFGTNGTSIRNILKRHHVERRSAAHQLNPIVTEEQKQRVVELCKSGVTLEEAGRQVGMHRSTVWKSTQAAGVDLNVGRERIYDVNDKVFNILTCEGLYWCGFLFADGNIFRDVSSARLTVGLSEIDIGHLEKFRKFLGSNHPIYIVEPHDVIINGELRGRSGRAVYLSVRSDQICDCLTGYGLVTKRTRSPISTLSNSRDFWRGMIDGDGSIGFTDGYPHIRLAGQRSLMESWQEFLKSNKWIYNLFESGGLWHMATMGKKAQNIVTCLYKDAEIYLDRKYKIALEII